MESRKKRRDRMMVLAPPTVWGLWRRYLRLRAFFLFISQGWFIGPLQECSLASCTGACVGESWAWLKFELIYSSYKLVVINKLIIICILINEFKSVILSWQGTATIILRFDWPNLRADLRGCGVSWRSHFKEEKEMIKRKSKCGVWVAGEGEIWEDGSNYSLREEVWWMFNLSGFLYLLLQSTNSWLVVMLVAPRY